jgi:hypothetical protein
VSNESSNYKKITPQRRIPQTDITHFQIPSSNLLLSVSLCLSFPPPQRQLLLQTIFFLCEHHPPRIVEPPTCTRGGCYYCVCCSVSVCMCFGRVVAVFGIWEGGVGICGIKGPPFFSLFLFCGWWRAIAIRETNKQSSKLVDILCTFLPLDFLPWKI